MNVLALVVDSYEVTQSKVNENKIPISWIVIMKITAHDSLEPTIWYFKYLKNASFFSIIITCWCRQGRSLITNIIETNLYK